MKAIWNNKIIAQSNDTIIIEGNHYFPAGSIAKEYFSATETHTTCPLKGVASYYKVNVDGNENVDGAWYYPNPKSGYEKIQNYVAFWKGIIVEQE